MVGVAVVVAVVIVGHQLCFRIQLGAVTHSVIFIVGVTVLL